MWIREHVQRCAICAELTPHSVRAIALPKLFGSAILAAGAGCFALESTWWPLGGLAVFAGAFVILWDRERFWSVACERCRWKRVAEVRKSNPRLGSTTTFDPI